MASHEAGRHELHTVPMDDPHLTHEHAHPSARTYIQIAVVLAIITAIEVAIYYVPDLVGEWFRPVLIPAFLILSLIKFVFVVGWYMHLKFDDPFFLRVFGFALIIGLTVVTAIIALFHGLYF